MTKRISVAAFAATLLLVGGMTWAATPEVSGISVEQGVPVVTLVNGTINGTNAPDTATAGANGSYTVKDGQTLTGTGATRTLILTGGNGIADGVTTGFGGNATLNINAGGTFAISGAGSGLTLKAGDGGGASAANGGAGGNAALINNGTVTFGEGSTLSIQTGQTGTHSLPLTGGAAGKINMTNNGAMTFMAGSIIAIGSGDSAPFALDNSGKLRADINMGGGFNNLIGILKAGTNSGNIIFEGDLTGKKTLGINFAGTTPGEHNGLITIAVAPTDDQAEILDLVDTGDNSLLIAPTGTTLTNPLLFSDTVTATGQAADGDIPAVAAITVAGDSHVAFADNVTGISGDIVFEAGSNVTLGGTLETTTSGNINIGNGVTLAVTGTTTTAADGDVTLGDNVNATFGDVVTASGAGALTIGDGSTVVFDQGAAVGTGGIDIAKATSVTFSEATTVADGGVTITGAGSAEFTDSLTITKGDLNLANIGTTAFKNAVTVADGGVSVTGAKDVTFNSLALLNSAKNILFDNSTVSIGGVATGDISAVNGTTLKLGDLVTGDVTVNASSLFTRGPDAGATNLTTIGKSTISIGNAFGLGVLPGEPGLHYTMNVGGDLELSQATSIVIEKGSTLTDAPTTLIDVAGASNAADWVAANAGITGSAVQNYTFAVDAATGKSIQVVGYGAIDAYSDTSRYNSANRMALLGVNNAGSLVDDSFGKALFNVANGVADGNSTIDVDFNPDGIGINGDVFLDKTTQAYQNAATTWSILRSFGGMGGAYGFTSNVEANSAASAMTGQNQASAVSSTISIANNNTSAVNSRIAANNVARAKVRDMVGSDAALASAMLNCNFANRFWVGGLGMWENAGSTNDSNGYTLDTWGLMTGYDHVFGPVTVGGSFGYSRGDFEEDNVLYNDSKIDNYAFNLYATYNHRSGFFASILGGYAYSDVDMNRSVVANAYDSTTYHVSTWSIGTNIGYDWKPMQNLTVTPRVGIYYIHAKSSTIGGNYTSIQDLKDYATQLPVDLSATYRIPMANGGLDLTARGGYSYNFNDSGAEGMLSYNNIVGVNPVSIKGRTPGRHTWNVGGGIKYQAGRFDVGVNYDYYSKSSYHAHRVTGVVGVSF